MFPWLLGAIVLLSAGWLLRRLLRLNRPEAPRRAGVPRLSPDRESLYLRLVREVEAHSHMVGVVLNEAIEQHRDGRSELAWRLARLSVAEWRRLTEILSATLSVIGRHLDAPVIVVPVRGKSAEHFKTRLMGDSARLHELLDQLVFRSNLRVQLHLRFLRRAVETLTAEYDYARRFAERTDDGTRETWRRLDYLYHDFDLIAKETLLATRAFLACLPDAAVESFATQLTPAIEPRAQAASSLVGK
jgi:hypothetical protein